MENKRSRNNAKSLFGINDIPSEAQIKVTSHFLPGVTLHLPNLKSTIFYERIY